jgi:hypothetical protein
MVSSSNHSLPPAFLSSLFAPPKSNQKVSNALPPLRTLLVSRRRQSRTLLDVVRRCCGKKELPHHPPGRWIHAPPNGKNAFVRRSHSSLCHSFTAYLSATREPEQPPGFQLPTPRFVRRVTGCRGLREPDKVPKPPTNNFSFLASECLCVLNSFTQSIPLPHPSS